MAETTSVGSSRSWSGAIVTPPRARGVFFHGGVSEKLRERVEGRGSRWRLASSGWSPSRWIWARTKVPNESALTALRRAQHQHRYDCAPARLPGALPVSALRTAGLS
eukprot:scaffold319_cov122-Isochrysis_galbana.AAC.3